MKSTFLKTILLACSSLDPMIAKAAVTGDTDDLNLDVMIEAIRQTENWDGLARGAAGERGPWQITPAVWVELSTAPFAWADGRRMLERAESRRVAREHLHRITGWLRDARYPVTPYLVALVWCAGRNATFYGRPRYPSRAKRAYADRAQNIYHAVEKDPSINRLPLFRP